MGHGSTLILLASALLFPSLGAQADPPTAADLAETREVRWLDPDEPELRDKAAELATAAAIYEFVRNEFDFVLYDGARTHSTNVFLNRRGNDVDLASTLIAMFRSQGIPARYATGIVSVSFAELTSWLEIPNVTRASSALSFAGFQNVSNSAGRTSFHHAWVRAFVPLARYRGGDAESLVDCMATPAECTWVDLDPSFKQRRYRDPAELVDVSDVVLFDYESYYRAEDPTYMPPDGLDRREKNPLEIYEEMILEHLHTTPGLEGRTLEDVVYEGEIIEERHGILPTSAPFRFDPAGASTYASVDDHDADAGQFDWSKTVSFTVRLPKHPELVTLTLSGGAPIPIAALADQSLTLAYESTDFDDPGTPKSLVARLGDQLHETIFTLEDDTFTWSGGSISLSELPDVDSPFDVVLAMEGNGTFQLSAVYPDLTLGGSFLVATGGAFSGFAEVRRSARRLLDDVEANPVLDDGSGVLYVDKNGDGGIDPGEPTLLEDAATQRRLTGGVLAIARDLYYAQVRTQIERLTKLQRTTMPPVGFLGLVSSVHDVRAVDGTAFSVTPVGLLVDMKAITVTPPYKIDQSNTENPRAFRLGGHILSSLEHEIWQEITGFEAISTMKGIQRTSRDGAALLALDEAESQVSIETALSTWGYEEGLPFPIQITTETLSLPLLGVDLWLPRGPCVAPETVLSVIPKAVDAGTPAIRRRGWELELTEEGSSVEPLFRFFEDLIDDLAALPNSNPLVPPYNVGEAVGVPDPACITATTVGQLENNLPTCFAALMDRPELQAHGDYVDYFDLSSGFVVDDHLYRDFVPARHIRSTALAPIRDELVLGADPDGNGIPNPNNDVEFVIPAIVADGELLDFAVWIQRYLDATGDEFATRYIINRSGDASLPAGSGEARSIRLDGVSQGFSSDTAWFDNQTTWGIANSWSFSVWLKPDDLTQPPGTSARTIFRLEGSGSFIGIRYFDTPSFPQTVRVSVGTPFFKNYDYQNLLSLNQWTHLALTWDGTDLILYRDGQPIAPDVMHADSTGATADDFRRLGWGEIFEGAFFSGWMAHLGIWDVALGGGDVAEIFDAKLDADLRETFGAYDEPAALVHYYRQTESSIGEVDLVGSNDLVSSVNLCLDDLSTDVP